MPALPKWLHKLTRPKACLLPQAGKQTGYAVYPRNDKRGRPLVCVSPIELEVAVENRFVRKIGQGFCLTASIRARLKRDALEQGLTISAQKPLIDRQVMRPDGMIETLKARQNESPLARWSRYLDPVELQAGEQIRNDHAISSLNPHTTSHWSMTAGCDQAGARNGPEEASLAAIAAKDRVMNAMAHVGTGMDRLIFAICIREQSMTSAECEFGWARRSGRTILKMALRRLAEHYGLIRVARIRTGLQP